VVSLTFSRSMSETRAFALETKCPPLDESGLESDLSPCSTRVEPSGCNVSWWDVPITTRARGVLHPAVGAASPAVPHLQTSVGNLFLVPNTHLGRVNSPRILAPLETHIVDFFLLSAVRIRFTTTV
jgi:hypothetical protein